MAIIKFTVELPDYRNNLHFFLLVPRIPFHGEKGIRKNNNFHEINCLEVMGWVFYLLQFKPFHVVLWTHTHTHTHTHTKTNWNLLSIRQIRKKILQRVDYQKKNTYICTVTNYTSVPFIPILWKSKYKLNEWRFPVLAYFPIGSWSLLPPSLMMFSLTISRDDLCNQQDIFIYTICG